MKAPRAACGCLVAVVLGAGAARADLVNGDFETGNLNGWTAAGSVSINSSQAHNGNFCALFQDTSGASLSQTVATTSGTMYVIDFFLKHPAATETGASFVVNWNGSPVLTLPTNTPGNYLEYQVTVTATGSSTPVQFVGTSGNQSGFWAFDDAHLTVATPEPATVVLFGVATPIAAGALWRRRRGSPAAPR